MHVDCNIKYEPIIEASARLYTLNYDETKTYMWAAIFVACNLVLPQMFHLIPQGGIIWRTRIFPWLTSTDPHDCISKGKTSHPYILQTL